MIVREFFITREDGVNLYKTFSDSNKYIVKEGEDFKYSEAIDVEDANFVYIETDEEIVEPENDLGSENGENIPEGIEE